MLKTHPDLFYCICVIAFSMTIRLLFPISIFLANNFTWLAISENVFRREIIVVSNAMCNKIAPLVSATVM